MRHFSFRLLAASMAAFIALPVVAPLACRVPKAIEITQPDRERMSQFDSSRVRALGEALLSTNANDRAILSALFTPAVEAIETMPDGDYRCRTVKLGGLLPLTPYGYFACRVSEEGTRIEKTSGSQRFTGTLTPTPGALFYHGALHYNDDPALAYGDDPDMNQVGCVYKIEYLDIYRLELPHPLYESSHDVIELIAAQ